MYEALHYLDGIATPLPKRDPAANTYASQLLLSDDGRVIIGGAEGSASKLWMDGEIIDLDLETEEGYITDVTGFAFRGDDIYHCGCQYPPNYKYLSDFTAVIWKNRTRLLLAGIKEAWSIQVSDSGVVYFLGGEYGMVSGLYKVTDFEAGTYEEVPIKRYDKQGDRLFSLAVRGEDVHLSGIGGRSTELLYWLNGEMRYLWHSDIGDFSMTSYPRMSVTPSGDAYICVCGLSYFYNSYGLGWTQLVRTVVWRNGVPYTVMTEDYWNYWPDSIFVGGGKAQTEEPPAE
jgi:hypothetical protein